MYREYAKVLDKFMDSLLANDIEIQRDTADKILRDTLPVVTSSLSDTIARIAGEMPVNDYRQAKGYPAFDRWVVQKNIANFVNDWQPWVSPPKYEQRALF